MHTYIHTYIYAPLHLPVHAYSGAVGLALAMIIETDAVHGDINTFNADLIGAFAECVNLFLSLSCAYVLGIDSQPI